MKTTLVVGASGATGRLVVTQLLHCGHKVRAIVRSPERLPEDIRNHDNLSIINASVLDLTDKEMVRHVDGCDGVVSCLGHNMSFKGMYGAPRKLVTDATRRLCTAIKATHPPHTVRFVLMNTTGNRNRDIPERVSFGQKLVVGLIRLLVPPHADNEQAADYLRTAVGPVDDTIEWIAVRPDGLIDENETSAYEVFPSPIRSAIFNPGKTSRINVAHFMTQLLLNIDEWNKWKGQMPVIYNKSSA
jgi:hypothetical protein